MNGCWKATARQPLKSGRSYQGYRYTARNIYDDLSNAAVVKGTIAEIVNDWYSLVEMRADMKNGDYVEFKVLGLEQKHRVGTALSPV